MVYCCVRAISLTANMDCCCIIFISTITLPPLSSLSQIWLIVVFMMALSLSLLSRTLSLSLSALSLLSYSNSFIVALALLSLLTPPVLLLHSPRLYH
jgi:hypothetical protein